MEFPQYFVQEWESTPEKNSACFDCSICLDFARDPVVTLCGHLYCWPCIYKWLDSQNSSDEPTQCPICKAQISEKTIVPLYGRGQTFSESEPEGKVVIPPRPPACNTKALTSLLNPQQQFMPPYHHHNHHQDRIQHEFSNNFTNYGEYSSSPFNLPTTGAFGEMIYARVFGNSQSLYTYPNSYHTVWNRSPRLRRLELRADESLNRVTIFLFCFFLLCLLVF
ncbi:ubiquitin ligase protein [Striga asiatica]|uniref:E3 ubiquitin-protein ligase RMA n=1 Tax=Striga asiatica TaxID=4170 RepID=A0A5A7NYU6_STRAF|nr:ubiquitin ligase protein [Striga asiatica]